MNILPKKSWHVLSKDNIQRVRRDEAAAKAAEEEKEHRAAFAPRPSRVTSREDTVIICACQSCKPDPLPNKKEREAQLDFMRKRAREREDIHLDSTSSHEASSHQANQHVNFFSDIQLGVGAQLTNKDHEQEKKSERESFEKRIGLLNYLVDKSKSDDPWYVAEKKAKDSAKSDRRKDSMDPMNDMKHYLTSKKKCVGPTQKPVLTTADRSIVRRIESQERHKRPHKKHKHKKSKEKDRERVAQLEKLRRERLRREESEKVKSEALLKQHYGVVEDSGPSNVETTPPRRYNSQFNPSLARY